MTPSGDGAVRGWETIVLEGPRPYGEVLDLQLSWRKAVESGEAGNALFLLEHAPTFTMGRNAHEHHLLRRRADLGAMGIDVVDVDRGGDVTYHGPGQLVAYPIFNLREWKPSIGWYLRALEETLIVLLDSYGVRGERLEKFTGVWVDGAKVAAIGIGLHDWVTYHGLALNVAPNMGHWSLIVPCGIPDKPVTSLASLLGEAPPMEDVRARLEGAFRHVFAEDYPKAF